MLKGPSLSKQIKEQQLLWFGNSNSYVIVDQNINELINLFVAHDKKNSFISAVYDAHGIPHSQAENFYNEILQFVYLVEMLYQTYLYRS